MSCLDTQAILDWVEGRLDEAARSRAETHVDECSSCRRLVAEVTKSARGKNTSAEGPRPLRAGDLVGRYRIEKPVGAGAMGVVYSAIDPDLERRVALKVMRPGIPAQENELEERLKREARALAKLSHPNVITVFDVGHIGGRVFLAMELVQGATLRGWLREKQRTTTEVIETFSLAGRGLAAAHSAGVVHRDFKPDNVLVGEDGRVRVTDFGLSRNISIAEEPEVVGTPAYMAPEQKNGLQATALADQFSFCLALFEALYGHRPQGSSSGKFKAARGVVPRSVARALARGLSEDPAKRFPEMNALLDALRPSAVNRGAAWSVVVLSSFGALYFFLQRDPNSLSCDDPENALQTLWNDAAKNNVRVQFERSGLPYAAASYETISARLETYTAGWREGAVKVCAEVEQKPERRLAVEQCLARKRAELGATVAILSRADAGVIERAVEAVSALPRLGECGRGVRAGGAPDLEAQIVEVRALERTGKVREALAKAIDLCAAAEARGERGVLAEGLFLRGVLEGQNGALEQEKKTLAEAVRAAEATRQDTLYAEIRAEQVFLAGVAADLALGAEAARDAHAAIDRLGGDDDLLADLLTFEGQLLWFDNDLEGAKQKYIEAIRLREKAVDEGRLSMTLEGLAAVNLESFDFEGAKKCYLRALEIRRRLVSEKHPATANTLDRLGGAYWASADLEKAEEYMRRALELRLASLDPDNPQVAESMNNLSEVVRSRGRHDEAIELSKRAIAIYEKRKMSGHPSFAISRMNLGNAFYDKGSLVEAISEHEAAVEGLKVWGGERHLDVAMALYYLARDHAKAGRCDRASSYYRDGLQIQEEGGGAGHPDRAFFLAGIGECKLLEGDAAAARPLLEESLAIREKLVSFPEETARVRALLDRATAGAKKSAMWQNPR